MRLMGKGDKNLKSATSKGTSNSSSAKNKKTTSKRTARDYEAEQAAQYYKQKVAQLEARRNNLLNKISNLTAECKEYEDAVTKLNSAKELLAEAEDYLNSSKSGLNSANEGIRISEIIRGISSSNNYVNDVIGEVNIFITKAVNKKRALEQEIRNNEVQLAGIKI